MAGDMPGVIAPTPGATALLVDFGGVLTVPIGQAFRALVDDLEHNLVGAARLGIQGLLHRTAEESVPRIREALSLPSPTPYR